MGEIIKKHKTSNEYLLETDKKIREIFTMIKNRAPEAIVNTEKKEYSCPGNVPIKHVFIGDRQFETTTGLYNFSENGCLYYCPTCLQNYNSEVSLKRHVLRCPKLISGSIKVYEERNLTVYKIEGRSNIPFCQALCVLGRCFIGNKTLYLDIENYNFYILFEGSSFVGYFSDEHFNEKHNLSCILILPDHQRKGYGTLMVDISYYFKEGTPEKPFSAGGAKLYNKYWTAKVNKYLVEHSNQYKSIKDISEGTNMTIDDVIIGLEHLGIDLHTQNEFVCKTIPCRFIDETRILK
ncbi:Histone acetyltransferase mst2 [Nosema granulosis]|uniref:Histone acetyltransferase n=1 Tax=Nosema granulosis TaxID=83296 RepID=A0A9P6KZ30_9MICR|nr:Histone acetyltransferase mst2 [Nosema granulosis]